ncbi:N-acetylmuramoyl-L-alanine amidase [Streptomyces niveus]|uniref:N-acetylmuramoyl-L-alanine amidase n=1 Tax=Streptomyces niveus TaxID=193462 RepID=UPI00369648F2
MLGVTWADPGAHIAGTVEARTRAGNSGQWSAWLRLDGDSGQGESRAVRGGTEPAWVGPSNAVEVRVRSGAGTSARLPVGLRLDMVDPGTGKVTGMDPAAFSVAEGAESDEPTPAGSVPEPEPGDSVSPTPSPDDTVSEPPPAPPPVDESPTESPTSGTPSPSAPVSVSPTPTVSLPPAPPSTAAKPPVIDRAGWGADESISPEEPGYLPDGKIKAVVVHHTAESNSYTCEQGPAVVRGIYAYHVQQLGWKDMGYNFIIDKCGMIYEGRKGGVDLPVMGAHAYGFNAETTGISVLGTYTDVAPPQAAMVSVARVAAWKLGQYGVSPTGTTTLTAGDSGRSFTGKTWSKGAGLSLPTIHGHRDGYNTQCPGDAFYNQLSTIRSWAGGPVAGLALKSITGTGVSGATHYTKSSVTVSWSATTPSALVKQYEILVDGKVAATAASGATSAKTNLAPGSHKIAVRAVHQSGRTSTTATANVVAETTAPTFTTKPALVLKSDTVNTAAVPVTLNWKATDGASLRDVRLTTPVTKVYGPTTYSAAHTVKSGAASIWNMTAYDQAGNSTSASVSVTPAILQETSATKSGSWTTKSSSNYLGGKSFSSSSKNASLTWTFTGKSAAWVVSRAGTSGQAYVYVDGVKAATVDLKSATTKYRDAIWTKTWTASAKHTIKVVVVGTTGRPAVTTDGLVYLK